MVFFLVFGAIMLLPGIFFMILAMQGRNPNNLISTTGDLSGKTEFKNYKLKNRSVPNAVEYTYTYQVKGKSYHLRGVQLTHPRNLRKRVTVVYLRSFPRCAYEEQFSGLAQWLLGISFSAMGAFLMLFYFLVA